MALFNVIHLESFLMKNFIKWYPQKFIPANLSRLRYVTYSWLASY